MEGIFRGVRSYNAFKTVPLNLLHVSSEIKTSTLFREIYTGFPLVTALFLNFC